MEKMSTNFRLLQKAFFDYDIQAHQELCEIENEFSQYLPLNELGKKTDYIFTTKSFARAIVKHVMVKMKGKELTLAKLTNVCAKECFCLELRSHMHIVRRQKRG